MRYETKLLSAGFSKVSLNALERDADGVPTILVETWHRSGVDVLCISEHGSHEFIVESKRGRLYSGTSLDLAIRKASTKSFLLELFGRIAQ